MRGGGIATITNALHNRLHLLIILVLCLLTVLLHLPLQVMPVARDQGVWLTAAEAISQGKVFYKEFLHYQLPITLVPYLICMSSDEMGILRR